MGLLDGFIDEGEAYYLRQLQEKYPTCAKLQAAFPAQNNTPQVGSFWQNLKRWFSSLTHALINR